MLKLASLALVPVLAATFYAHQDSQDSTDPAEWTTVENQDRQFLDDLDQRGNSESADRQFLTQLQTAEIATRPPMEVRRAIAVTHEPVAAEPAVVTNPPAAVAVAEAAPAPEVRRAIPVSAPATAAPSGDLRKSLNQSFVTLVEPDASDPAPKRSSIVIYGDQVVIHTRGMVQRGADSLQ